MRQHTVKTCCLSHTFHIFYEKGKRKENMNSRGTNTAGMTWDDLSATTVGIKIYVEHNR